MRPTRIRGHNRNQIIEQSSSLGLFRGTRKANVQETATDSETKRILQFITFPSSTPLHVDESLRHTDPEQIVWDTIITREEIEAHILIFNQALRLRRIIQDALRNT
jgi:hypothetical protein